MFKNFNSKFLEIYFSEQSRWIHWFPVGLIFGICTYFSLQEEPKIYSYITLLSLAILLFINARKYPQYKLITYTTIGFCIGFLSIGFHVNSNNTPMFNHIKNSENIYGYIKSIENHPYKDDKYCRIILDHIKIDHKSYPAKLRLNISTKMAEFLQINDQLTVSGRIYPIPMPSSLYGYFARRAAFLQGIAGTVNVKNLKNHKKSEINTFKQHRFAITQKLLSNIEQPYGSIAAALVTGERSYIPHELRQFFIDAGLAHILAISGLHLSIISGIIFLLLRRLLCMMPITSVFFSAKKISACLTVIATMFYMALANFGIPVQRSFVMISIAMLAICLDRTPFSMRSLAIAASTILIIAPESILSASFQLSFIAVLGLLAFYESTWFGIREKLFQNSSNFLGTKKILLMLLGILATTFIASLATTPYSIAFFQRFTLQSILGNLLAIPLISLVVMPLGLISVLSLLFFENNIFFLLWSKSLKILCIIAEKVASLPGAAIQVKAAPSHALLVLSIGMLWTCIWKKTWRWLGVIPIILSVFLWRIFEPPIAYVNSKNDVMAYRKNDIMYISNPTINKFTTNIWAQEWGIAQIKPWKKPFCLLDKEVLLIVSPKEGIQYLHENLNNSNIKIIITFGYEKTLKKHGLKVETTIDRNIIQYEEGLAIYTNPSRIYFLKDFFGTRPWCPNY